MRGSPYLVWGNYHTPSTQHFQQRITLLVQLPMRILKTPIDLSYVALGLNPPPGFQKHLLQMRK